MTMHTHRHGAGASIAGAVSMVVLAVGLVVTAADLPMAWLVWPLGYGVVLPLAVGYAARRQDSSETRETSRSDPVSDLHDRYVEGELDERGFERELETVLSEEEDGTA